MEYMELGQNWNKVIFSDEKKFNLDGPDGLHYYWRDLRKENRQIMSRNFGGGSVMIWAAFSYTGKSKIAFISERLNSEKYCLMLENYLLPFARSNYGHDFIFQQDNARIHTSMYSKEWFEANNVILLNHPPLSPDLNPIENLWGQLTRAVFQNGR